ncbi:hypothetical protein V9K92_06320 [Phyllobacterium sp. CCNWLW109]|uniref:hypothetical protein n=1 Tax=Phyllobacterium sp. CCNWLW109 TaxID=3127479 RepID=UPI003077EE27
MHEQGSFFSALDPNPNDETSSNMRNCKADGCFKQTNGYSSYCERHKRTLARHGHPHQIGIKKSDLKPYIKDIETYLTTKSASNSNAILNDIWARTVRKAQDHTHGASNGVPFNGHSMNASKAIVSLSKEIDSATICKVLMAMGFWYEFNQRQWKYDEGFRFQTVRMLLRLNPREAAYEWSMHGLTRSVYREVPPKTIKAIWSIINETKLVGFGMEIAKRTEKELKARRQRFDEERTAIIGLDRTEQRGETV